MISTQEFKEKGYIHLKDFLHKDSCKELANELKRLVNEKKTVKDEQCPKSEAVHGTVTFDKLLEDLLPHFEQASGLKLFPTYSYARLYNNQGEELKVHRDRPACEISATLTLDFEGDVWPIFMGANEDKSEATEVKMEIGDAVMYRGCDIYHWREAYKEGKWQAQVFLHYVDQNGPYAEWKYDKRKSLGVSKTESGQANQAIEDCYIARDVVTPAFCNKLIQEYSKPEVEKEPPYIGVGKENIDLNIRNVQRLQLPLYAGIGATLTAIGLNVNNDIWKYTITHSNQSEFLMYDVKGKYETHVDTFHAHSNEIRKLTILVFLNDDFEGGKFYIQNSHERTYPEQKKGTVLIFPSFMPHGVEPITKGVRYSIVTWMVGPYFK
jgi:predicted 2-oxoglutarate/Fe(II)-dependent dioxygenase YbiX